MTSLPAPVTLLRRFMPGVASSSRDRAQIVVFAYESGLVQAGDLDIGH